ncbi:MAG: hypothetical protein HC888_05235 [Candidatus Competibacteraceae bacterium]|nr:hypothetical protein [Candidatus Competibacteraceae bacterium]
MTRRTIDLTPTWAAILPSILAVLEHAQTEEARDNMKAELRRMADAADRWNEHVRREARVKKELG